MGFEIVFNLGFWFENNWLGLGTSSPFYLFAWEGKTPKMESIQAAMPLVLGL